VNLEIVNPLQIPNWDDLLLATGKGSFFHSSAWARVLHESYGYKPLYFTSLENGKLSCLLPFMEVNSWLTGKRGVSLPFTDQCRFLAPPEIMGPEMLLHVIEWGKRAAWKYVECRDGSPLTEGETVFAKFQFHTLELEKDLGSLYTDFRPSTQRNIRKAFKEGLSVDVLRSSDAVKEFYRLHCLTRKSHGFPPQPYTFFEKIFEHIISAGKGFVLLAKLGKIKVAGAVFFHFGDTVLFKYGASDKCYHHLRSNNLVMWEAIRWCKDKSFRRLDLGRTNPDHKGLLQFKAGWGTRSKVVPYYKYDLRKKAFVREGKTWALVSRLAGSLPSPLFNQIGSLLYKHIG
jgi:hypothetical protein